jgi:pimeloyl-ACP methyl ester carboxylesterase
MNRPECATAAMTGSASLAATAPEPKLLATRIRSKRHAPAPRTGETSDMSRHLTVSGVTLELEERGVGRPLLFLHPGEGLQPNRSWLSALARSFRVIAPHHPGFGGSSLPDWFGSVDDLAYLYLDLAAALDLQDAILVGACFGGWIAAEIGVRNTSRFAGLVLADPLGIKIGGVLDRDIVDMHSIPRQTFLQLAWADPAQGEVDYAHLPDTELAGIARGREALALYGWKPYMHNPRLKHWLHRIDIPTHIVWGEQDGIVSMEYGEGWRSHIPGATMETISGASHYPHWEQPDRFAASIAAFAAPL